MVHPTGIATAIIFLPSPLVKKLYPSSSWRSLTVFGSDLFVLNISFRITSNFKKKRINKFNQLQRNVVRVNQNLMIYYILTGFVKAAPATPATADFVAERHNLSRSAVGLDESI